MTAGRWGCPQTPSKTPTDIDEADPRVGRKPEPPAPGCPPGFLPGGYTRHWAHTQSLTHNGGRHWTAAETACQGKEPRIMANLPRPPEPSSQPAPKPGPQHPSEPGEQSNQVSGSDTHTHILATFNTKHRAWNLISDKLKKFYHPKKGLPVL